MSLLSLRRFEQLGPENYDYLLFLNKSSEKDSHTLNQVCIVSVSQYTVHYYTLPPLCL